MIQFHVLIILSLIFFFFFWRICIVFTSPIFKVQLYFYQHLKKINNNKCFNKKLTQANFKYYYILLALIRIRLGIKLHFILFEVHINFKMECTSACINLQCIVLWECIKVKWLSRGTSPFV